MSQRETAVDMDEALREANERADRAEQEVGALARSRRKPRDCRDQRRWRS